MYLKQIYDELVKINTKLENIRKKIPKSQNDTRLINITSMQFALGGCALSNHSLSSIEKKVERKFIPYFIGNNKEPIEKSFEIMNDFLRLGLITLYQFRIENLFVNLIMNLGKNKNRSYLKNCEKLIKSDLLSINDKNFKFNVFKTFSYIRNTLHNNGIHYNDDFYFKLNNFDYEFIKNKKVTCASWEHIINIIDYTVDILEVILHCKEITNLGNPIPEINKI